MEEGDAGIVIQALPGAVLGIANNGTVAGGHLGADLMIAAGHQQDPHQAKTVSFFKHRAGQFTTGPGGIALGNDPGPEIIMRQPVDQRSFRRPAFDYGQVFLAARLSADRGIQPRQGLVGAGKDDDAGSGPVKAVDGVEEDIAGLGEFGLEPGLGAVFEAVGVLARRLGCQSGRLVDYQNMIVAEEDVGTVQHGHHSASGPLPVSAERQPHQAPLGTGRTPGRPASSISPLSAVPPTPAIVCVTRCESTVGV